ncbi:hypothetical protein D3C76_1063450 [compost metagenome]
MPVAFLDDIDGVPQGNLEALQVAQQRNQQGDGPHRHAGDHPGDEAAVVGALPVQHGQRAGEELQGGDEGNDAEVGQVVVRAEQGIEPVAGEDDGDDQYPPGPFQPAIDVAFGGRLVKRQDQVVEHHAG